MAIVYKNGRGVERDSIKAVYYLRKGCNSNARCAYYLGVFTYDGLVGLTKDEDGGIKYIKYAAGLGEQDAIRWLRENEESSFKINGYKGYVVPKDGKLFSNHYCTIYFKDIELIESDLIELKLWIVNRNHVSITIESKLEKVNGKRISELKEIDVNPGELKCFKMSFQLALLSDSDADMIELLMKIKDKELFGTINPVLLNGLVV